MRRAGVECPLTNLRVVRTDHGVTVAAGAHTVDLVEHVLSALGGMGIERDVRIDVYGPELPLLDGGGRRFADALSLLSVAPTPRRCVIARDLEMREGEAVYRFRPASGVAITVEIEFEHPLVLQRAARWCGEAEDYRRRIAPARTFGFRRDAERLLRAGRARAVDLAAVVVLDDDGTSPSLPPPSPDECARHKLLDLIGDLTLAGGVPVGRIDARRPGHGATHAVLARAFAEGVMVSV